MIFTVISLALAIKRCIDLSKNQQRNLFMKILLIFFNIWGAYHYPIIYSLITSFIMFYVKKDVTIWQNSPQLYNQAKDLVEKLNAVKAQIKKNKWIIKFSENASDIFNAIKQNENLNKLSKILSRQIEQLTNYISKKNNLT